MILGVCGIPFHDMSDSAHFTGIVANKFSDTLTPCPCLTTGRVIVAKLVLRCNLVFQGTTFEAVCDGRKCARFQALIFQRQSLTMFIEFLYNCDVRQISLLQPLTNLFDVFVSVRMFCAGVCKQDQINGDFPVYKTNKQGGTVRTASKG